MRPNSRAESIYKSAERYFLGCVVSFLSCMGKKSQLHSCRNEEMSREKSSEID